MKSHYLYLKSAVTFAAISFPIFCCYAQDFAMTDVSTAAGLDGYTMAIGMAGGVSAADYDNDGDIDLFVPTAGGFPDQLFQNNGDGTFTEIAALAGVAETSIGRAALWFDYDADGDLDLVVAGDCFDQVPCDDAKLYRMYRQDSPTSFVDVTANTIAGYELAEPHVGALAAGDLNNDGWLDLIITHWKGGDQLFLNDRNGGFNEVGAASGVGAVVTDSSWQPIIHDFNDDGWMDLFVAIDFAGNRLWLNNQDGTFTNIAPSAGVNNAFNDMGVAFADYDNDGDIDFYITNIFQNGRHSVLYRNDTLNGVPAFTEVSFATNTADGGWGWGCTFADLNNDGWVDLPATNGFMPSLWPADSSRVWLNQGGPSPTFVDVAATVGFNDLDWGSGLIAIDSDRDGDLDLVQTCQMGGPLRLCENQITAANQNYLVVKPRMAGPNTHAIGAVVQIEAQGMTQTRLITAGTSMSSQEPAEAFFGLGAATSVDTLTVHWPNGKTTTQSNLAANRVITVRPVLPPAQPRSSNGAALPRLP